MVRDAISERFRCDCVRQYGVLGKGTSRHDYDIFAQNAVVGGVTTAKARTSSGNSNTGAKDRLLAEVLWLQLWEGDEKRLIVITDPELRDLLSTRLGGVRMNHQIHVYVYDTSTAGVELAQLMKAAGVPLSEHLTALLDKTPKKRAKRKN